MKAIGTAEPTARPAQRTDPSARRKGAATAVLALALLSLAHAFNVADRLLLGVVQEPIKREFQLSDFELGLLGGAAFAILYSIMSLPIARIADRVDRITITSVAVALFSGMSALCGLAGSYTQLFLARVGVSVGEAGASAPSVSYLSELFSPQRRATAMAVFGIGGPLGGLLAIIVGGQITQAYGWRAAFLAMGGAGLVLALLIRVLLREARAPVTTVDPLGFGESLRRLLRKRSYVHICASAVFASFTLTFVGQYMLSFLIRTHGMSIGDASLLFGLTGGLAGTVGVLVGGYAADRVAQRWPGARTLVPAAAFVISSIGYTLTWWTPLAVGIPLLFVASFFSSVFTGVNYAVATAVALPAQRATAVAFLSLGSNLIGYALGPPLLGALSDAARVWELAARGIDPARCVVDAATAASAACLAAQADGLRWALTTASVLALGGAFHQWRASKTLARDIEG